jgi:hypothetical protein
MLRRLILQELSTLKPETLSLQDVFRWEGKCGSDKLAKAILNDVVTHASLGLSFTAIANILYTATSERTCTLKAKTKSPLMDTHGRYNP